MWTEDKMGEKFMLSSLKKKVSEKLDLFVQQVPCFFSCDCFSLMGTTTIKISFSLTLLVQQKNAKYFDWLAMDNFSGWLDIILHRYYIYWAYSILDFLVIL